MAEKYTSVEIAFYPEHANDWLRFGVPAAVQTLDRWRSLALFCPGQTLGYVRWRAGDYGTASWQFVVVRVGPATALARLQGIDPGAVILLAVSGATLVKRALDLIDRLETDGFNPVDVSPDYFRHLHNRLATGTPPKLYTSEQHTAWQARHRALS